MYSILSISNVKDPIRYTARGVKYFIYSNDSIVPVGTTHVAIAPSSIPTSVEYLALLNGFDVQLTEGMLPKTIEFLFIGAIKKPILKGSIPDGIRYFPKYKQQLTSPSVVVWHGNGWQFKTEF
ncbi:hypothetical protein ACTFIY_004897 [Dictyostelium cf. discoideum]